MDAEIADLERRMLAAAKREDFEDARRLRDQINLLRGGATTEEAARADTSGLSRQIPGAMGIGTNKAKPVVPRGWKTPKKPDPMTSGRRPKRR
ncbi:UvrB/UvrC motif-containing protein [Novosphingobium sp. CECT 9465]|uniref:UvrB/UvrC motif-containing protein n=1 Tax=Novosphingobium sp. CECT 9465 TaxID=2829794 RepID=UPI001E3A615A|nr:UvrB/UvrC motif-containing protein [Novosphingobium sp. CECT 9465]